MPKHGRTRPVRAARVPSSCPAATCSSPRKRTRRRSSSSGQSAPSRWGCRAGVPSRPVLRGEVEPGDHRYVALAVWWPGKALRKACADFSDLKYGLDGRLYVLSDKSGNRSRGCRTSRRPGARPPPLRRGGSATWTGKPEGLAFTPNGRALVALDTRKARHNLVLLEPANGARLTAQPAARPVASGPANRSANARTAAAVPGPRRGVPWPPARTSGSSRASAATDDLARRQSQVV